MAVAGPYLKEERSTEMQSAREAAATEPLAATDPRRGGDLIADAPSGVVVAVIERPRSLVPKT
jgi:hypothetical protein